MKRYLLATFLCLAASSALLAGGLEDFLSNVNIQARGDMNGFKARVSTQFNTPLGQVQAVLSSVSDPSDAFMVFQLSAWTHQPPEQVLKVYRSGKGKGWGVLAKELGIKPGSAEFHALKRGDLRFEGDGNEGPGKGKGKGKGHGKGKHGR